MDSVISLTKQPHLPSIHPHGQLSEAYIDDFSAIALNSSYLAGRRSYTHEHARQLQELRRRPPPTHATKMFFEGLEPYPRYCSPHRESQVSPDLRRSSRRRESHKMAAMCDSEPKTSATE